MSPIGGALAAFVAFVTAIPRAPSDARIAQLTWSAPQGCPSSAEVERIVATRLPPGLSVRASGTVERVGGRFRLNLDIESRGTRVLEAKSCNELAEGMAVIIAMSQSKSAGPTTNEASTSDGTPPEEPYATHPPAEASTSSTETALAPSVEPPTKIEEPRAPPRREAPTKAERDNRRTMPRVRPILRADATTNIGMLAFPAAGIGVAAGVEANGVLHAELFGTAFFAQDKSIAESPTRGARLQMVAFGGRGCVAVTRRVELAPCLGLTLMRLTASSFGNVRNGDAASTVVAPEALVGLRVPIAGPLTFRMAAGATFPLSRDFFVVNGLGVVHRPAAVAFHGFAGPEMRF